VRVNVCAHACSGVGWGWCRERRDHDVLKPRARAESGELPSSTWTYNYLILIYLLMYNFLVFMIM
jgi:hypothetical protein